MKVSDLRLNGLKSVSPQIFLDDRGFFFESYALRKLIDQGIDTLFVQDNISHSKKGTLRGLHFQESPGQAKLISCIQGTIWDVAVDIHPKSPTFGSWEAVILDDQERRQLFIPIGFAHGFCVLSEEALVQYKVSSPYDPLAERTIRWNDPHLAIDWPVKDPILADRDRSSPLFKELFL